jgi:hypothetical protein
MVAMSDARRVARTRWVGWLGRMGFAAQGTCFVVIAALALQLAFGSQGHLTDPRGAFVLLAEDGWTRVLVVFLAIGFAASALAPGAGDLDRGGMGTSAGGLGRRWRHEESGSRHPRLAGRARGSSARSASVSASSPP